jgi:hypothetical protein
MHCVHVFTVVQHGAHLQHTWHLASTAWSLFLNRSCMATTHAASLLSFEPSLPAKPDLRISCLCTTHPIKTPQQPGAWSILTEALSFE